MDFSIGFHTFAIFQRLTYKEAATLLNVFRKQTDTRTFQVKKSELPPDADGFVKKLYASMPRYYVMDYPDLNKGITWVMRICSDSPGFLFRSDGWLDGKCY